MRMSGREVWLVFMLSVILCMSLVVDSKLLKVGFYNKTCPSVETVIRQAVGNGISSNPGIEGGVLRMHFHDCFVNGCDGSVLIDSTTNSSEKFAIPNQNLRGFEVIDAAKSAVEAVCAGVVSCADVVAYAARDAVLLTGGKHYDVEAGRRDGLRSNINDTTGKLPGFTFNVSQLTSSFAINNLTQEEMIILSGAHTIGSAHCASVTGRLYNFNSTFSNDPSMDPVYASYLQGLCPKTNADANLRVNLDVTTPRQFDNVYYKNLLSGKGFLSSDQVLERDSTTVGKVKVYAKKDATFQKKFGKAMVQMGRANVLTGSQGEIRKNCRQFNSPSSTTETIASQQIAKIIQQMGTSLTVAGDGLLSETVAESLHLAHTFAGDSSSWTGSSRE